MAAALAKGGASCTHEVRFENGYRPTDGNDDGSDDGSDDGLATDEAAAIAEAMAQAAALNTTLQSAKRQHEDDAQPEVP